MSESSFYFAGELLDIIQSYYNQHGKRRRYNSPDLYEFIRGEGSHVNYEDFDEDSREGRISPDYHANTP